MGNSELFKCSPEMLEIQSLAIDKVLTWLNIEALLQIGKNIRSVVLVETVKNLNISRGTVFYMD